MASVCLIHVCVIYESVTHLACGKWLQNECSKNWEREQNPKQISYDTGLFSTPKSFRSQSLLLEDEVLLGQKEHIHCLAPNQVQSVMKSKNVSVPDS